MLQLEDAVQQILAVTPTGPTETVPIDRAHRRVNARDIRSTVDLPRFTNSAMDGYAVCASDVAGASAQSPVALRLIGRVAAGEVFQPSVQPGTCVRLFTGSPLPDGADAVVMQEDTQPSQTDPGQVLVTEGVSPRENVRFQGEDIACGETIGRSGQMLSASQVAILAATGTVSLEVGSQPKVALLATGSELQEAGTALEPGQIYESNRATLAALIRSAGGIPTIYPIVPDKLESTREALVRAFSECDLVITSGGVSVGEMDFVKQAFQEIGGALTFWRVAIKPGRPFVLGRYGQKLLFGLPGNPVSAFVTFLLLVRPALLRFQGATDCGLPTRSGIVGEALGNPGGRRHFMRVKADVAGKICSAGQQSSHCFQSLSAATALVDVPPDTTLAPGQVVQLFGWD